MDPIVIIPARYGSTRLPAKALHNLHGKPLIHHTAQAALRTGLPVFVATDDERIRDAAVAAGVGAIMTSRDHENGTERCAEAAHWLDHDGPIVNWQGDSPLVPPDWIHALVEAIEEGAHVATPVQRCPMTSARQIRADYCRREPGATTTALDSRGDAIYFSKAPIPSGGPFWLHVGIYAYSAAALAAYGNEPSVLEKSEKLEQLRFLERGVPIRCVPFDGPPIWEVNNFHDIRIVEKMMEERDEVIRT